MTKEGKRLVVNISVLLLMVVAIVISYNVFFGEKKELTIDETPIQIESIRTIAEISTVSYKDEVVMDSVEYETENYAIYDPRKLYELYNRGVKRRLTMIITGEVRYGVDLSDNNFSVSTNKDSIHLILPEPSLLDVIIVPSKTQIYLEKGSWRDSERHKLETGAKYKFKQNAVALNLEKKARENTERLFKKLIMDKRTLVIEFKKDE
ncbi:MAG: hypothetical protein A3D92_02625 [Bacteroidetes bacterium RIFCSPHIGHO2_02_FULL_44_7]|nr:MAG: hypothetical protein A3D92_02625 [Bacteroidetes bacterium RIFCSPHIGHO2_02_FULL_44_7]